MDLTNRVLIVCGALVWVFVILGVILLTWGAPDESIEQLSDLAGYLADENDTPAQLIVTFGGLILILMAVIVIIFEVAPPGTESLKIERVGGGEAHIGTEEVAHWLEEELQTMPQLKQVQARVVARGRKAEVSLDLHVGAEADLSTTTEEVCRSARQLIEERVGVALARPPQVQLHYQELQVARPQEARASAPAGAATSASSPTPSPPEAGAPGANPAESLPGGTQETHETTETSHEDRPAGA